MFASLISSSFECRMQERVDLATYQAHRLTRLVFKHTVRCSSCQATYRSDCLCILIARESALIGNYSITISI